MILTGQQIIQEVGNNNIIIEPFYRESVNPNSYNYRLGKELKICPNSEIDSRIKQEWQTIIIPESGFILSPQKLYLGRTLEKIGSNAFVTSLIGRSSIGRLGVYLQVSADLGQLGAIHQWTLELVVVQPVKVYAGMRIGQVSFWQPIGDIILYDGIHGHTSVPLEAQTQSLFL